MAAVTRADFRNALFTLLDTRRAASPASLNKVYRYRPSGVGEATVAWVGNIVENLTYDQGTRTHVQTAEVILATPFPSDLVTSTDDFDALLANLIEDFTNAVHAVNANTILSLGAIEDGEIAFSGPQGDVIKRGATLTVRHDVWEGRI